MATREGDRSGPGRWSRPARLAADFVLATGRCLLRGGRPAVANPHQSSAVDRRGRRLRRLARPGPAIPDADLAGAQALQGGLLFRENCAACHQAGGAGAVLSAGRPLLCWPRPSDPDPRSDDRRFGGHAGLLRPGRVRSPDVAAYA
ncbi:MAG: cytochrome c [Ilumatobacteraceae bacterium]